MNAVITYAFSLYGLGRSREGVEIMRKLPTEALHEPRAAAYAALLLLDENQVTAAQEYIVAAQAGPMFPEEKKLLDEAIAKTSTAAPSPSAAP